MVIHLPSILIRGARWGVKILRDIVRCTFDKIWPSYLPLTLGAELNTLIINNFEILLGHPTSVISHYLSHRFDFLGSGWRRVKYGMNCSGLESHSYKSREAPTIDPEGHWLAGRINRANLREAQRIWRLIDKGYEPIDWQLDFKSGYRWSEKTWYRKIRFGHEPGVDVKVPWELARMQHLPQIALAHGSQRARGFNDESIVREFRNQILDFIATNPPRFGVNWACTMDVAIRLANWLVAYDIFRSTGCEFDQDFETVFLRSVNEHGRHIVRNLEWFNGIRGNHYLANIAGLAFAAAYLPRTTETDAWLAFAVQELIEEVAFQFYAEGTNFEGSTAYHRLAAEMVIYSTALIVGLPEDRMQAMETYDHRLMSCRPKLRPAPRPLHAWPGSDSEHAKSPFPLWYFERIERMGEFVRDITKPDGHIPQIGDNDSGRFLKLSPIYQCMKVREAKKYYLNLTGYDELDDDAQYFQEDHLDCRHLVASVCGLIDRPDLWDWLQQSFEATPKAAFPYMDTACIKALAGASCVASQKVGSGNQSVGKAFTVVGESCATHEPKQISTGAIENQTRVTEFNSSSGDLREGLVWLAYHDFGLYLLKSDRVYLAIRCWSGDSHFYGAHFHNDQLSIELTIDGRDLILDPGSYLYTPIQEERNKYRSVHAHFTPWAQETEPSDLNRGLFCLPKPPPANIEYFGPQGFAATLLTHPTIYRFCAVTHDRVNVFDGCCGVVSREYQSRHEKLSVSQGYGILVDSDGPNRHASN
jgi:hypothetical protein